MQTDTLEKWTRTVDCSDSVNSLSLTRARRGPSGRQRDSFVAYSRNRTADSDNTPFGIHTTVLLARPRRRGAPGGSRTRAGRPRPPAAPAPPSPGTNRIDRPRLTSPVGRLEALRAAPGSRAAPVRSLRRGLLRHGRRDAPPLAVTTDANRAKLSPCV